MDGGLADVAGAMSLVFVAVLVKTIRAGNVIAMPHAEAAPGADALRGQRRRDVLRDWRFLAFVPSMVAPAAILTGYFFHQRLIGEQFGWGLEDLAVGFAFYAGTALFFAR